MWKYTVRRMLRAEEKHRVFFFLPSHRKRIWIENLKDIWYRGTWVAQWLGLWLRW